MAVTPSISRVTGNDTNKYFHLTWIPPNDDEKDIIHGYFVEQSLVGSSFGWIRLNDNILRCTDYTVTDLEPGKWYKYRIVIVKDEAEYCGEATEGKQAIHIPLRPSQPVVFDITNRSCSLEWMAPDFDGGSPITRYEIEIKQDGHKWTSCCSVSGDKKSTKVENLSENGTYVFRVRALNLAGYGNGSIESKAIKAAGIDLSHSNSLVQLDPVALERKGMKSVTESFETGISYLIKLMESLSKLTASVTYKEADAINIDIWFYSERLYYHMRQTLDKTEALSSEINKRIESVIYEISKKEQEQRKNEIKSANLDQQIRNLQSELDDLQKEKIEAEQKYEAIKRDLREAETKLREARDTQDTVKLVGTVGLFVPIVGWAVSAVTLPLAFTVLQDNVDAAKIRVSSEHSYKCAKEQQVDAKMSEIQTNIRGSQNLRDSQTQLQNDIRQFKELRERLKENLNQQAETSVEMKKCVNFVGGAQCRAEVLHDQIKHFYDLSVVLEPLLDMARHLSSNQASALGMLPSNFHVGIAAGKLQMIAATAECRTSLNTPAYLHDFREVPTILDGSDGTRTIMKIHSLSQELSSFSHDDERMVLTEYVNCSGFLGSAPSTNALIGQLLLISLKHDFCIDEKQPVDGFKFLKQPKSFRVSMFQTATSASEAFFLAHRNMDQIKLYSKASPFHLKKALKMLECGSSQEICRLLGKPLSIIKQTSEKCLELAKAVQLKFADVVLIMDELQEACVSTKSQMDKKQKENKAMSIEAEQEKANWENKKLLSQAETKRKQQSLQHEQDMFEKAKSKDVTKGVLEGIAYKVLSKDDKGLDPLRVFGPTEEKKFKENKDITLDRSQQAEEKKNLKLLEENIDVNDAETLLEDAVSLENNTKELHAALCNMKETNMSIDVRTCKAKYERIKRRDCYLSKEHSQINQAFSLSGLGLDLCQNIIPLCESMNSEDKQLKLSVEKLRKDCEKFVEQIQALKLDAENKWTADLERKLKSTKPKDSDNETTGNNDLDQVKYKVGITFRRMVKADAEHDRAAQKARRARKELANIVSEIAKLDMETLDLDQIVDLLCRCLKELGILKEEWGKMISLFQRITNIIDTTLNTSLKGFVDVSKTTKFDKPETFKLSGQKRQILYEDVMKASEVAYFIEHFTESYTEVSEKFFLPVLEALPRLLKSSDKGSPKIEEKLKQLQAESITAQTGINDHLDRKQRHFKSTIQVRLAAIEECLNGTIPEIESTCIGTLDPDDFA